MSVKDHFPRAREAAYLDTAAEGLPPDTTEAALSEYLHEKSRGTPGRIRLFEKQKETEAAAAQLLTTSPDNIALLSHSSEALNLLATSIEWREGDEVLLCDLEFPSNVVVWLRLKEMGVRVIVIPSSGGVIRLEDWTSRLSSRTRVVSLSQVSYKTGTQLPYLPALAEEVHRAGALLCVDATQALGRVPVSVEGIDYLVASSYKWLLGAHGIGVVYMPPEVRERVRPKTAGWYSLATVFHPGRFENYTLKSSAGQLQSGMPNFPGIFALAAGIDFLQSVGIDRLDRELRPLMNTLRSGLQQLGFQLLTPVLPEFASGIVSFECGDPAAVASWLASQNVIVWGGDGRVRISVHIYNDESDVRQCLDALQRMPANLRV